jgi:hypothetical protein
MLWTHPLYRESIQQQAIGWQHFLRGRIATSLVTYQEKYYRDREQPSTVTGESWAKKLMQQVWAHFFDMFGSSGVQNDMSWTIIEHHDSTHIASKHALAQSMQLSTNSQPKPDLAITLMTTLKLR